MKATCFIDAYFCLGSNITHARDYVAQAIHALSDLEGCSLVAASSPYLTEPQNYANQPWFHNQVIKMAIADHLTPRILMQAALDIEKKLGRQRNGPRYGPRAIDIDILLFGDIASSDPFCTLPHPRLVERAFALVPLLEIAPEIKILGRSAQYWLAALDWRLDGNKIFQ